MSGQFDKGSHVVSGQFPATAQVEKFHDEKRFRYDSAQAFHKRGGGLHRPARRQKIVEKNDFPPGPYRVRCISIVAFPYSSSYVAETVSRGSFPFFRIGTKLL